MAMRYLVAAAAIMVVPRTVRADTTCYAGTERIELPDGPPRTTVVVLEHERDRGARVIRRHRWTETHLDDDTLSEDRVAADGKTFTFAGGHGTFWGSPWQWTGYHAEGERNGVTFVSDATFDQGLSIVTRVTRGGKPAGLVRVSASELDCKELDRRRAAFDDSAPDAVRTCYAGSETSSIGASEQVIVEQITEAARIRLVHSAKTRDTTVTTFAIAGDAITVTDADHGWQGHGTITGPRGAWTGYAFTAHLDHGGDADVHGTLGGDHLTRATELSIQHAKLTLALDATRFDCKALAAKRAALRTQP